MKGMFQKQLRNSGLQEHPFTGEWRNMDYNPFRLKALLRIVLLSLSIFAFFYFLLYLEYFLASSVMFALAVIQIYLLFRYFDRTNRELSRFFNSVKFSDFSQNFMSRDTDDSLKELKASLINVMNQFREARSEKEEQFQYLQTVVKHIGTGLISFKQNGEVELINNSAKKLLNVQDLKNINNLPRSEKGLINNFYSIKSGEKELIKISANGDDQHISMSAIEFKMRGEKYTLVSLQDIKNELERERMANEFEIAHRLQMRLLPKTNPVLNGYSISSVCHPAKEVGGDYYDYIDLKNGKTGIVIGDVAGKGMPAAFYMTLTKGIFQACAEKNDNPADVLMRINNIICKSIAKGSFVTITYAVLDPGSNKVKFARGGHEPMLVYRKNENNIYECKPKGMGIGLDCGEIFNKSIEECEIELAKDDIMFFYTDGLTDLRDKDNNEYGLDQLKKIIIENSHLSSSSLTKAILEDVNSFKGDFLQYDDLTMIAIKNIRDK
jgi:serine phosphatase RsbU (regulator of sigma subunit)